MAYTGVYHDRNVRPSQHGWEEAIRAQETEEKLQERLQRAEKRRLLHEVLREREKERALVKEQEKRAREGTPERKMPQGAVWRKRTPVTLRTRQEVEASLGRTAPGKSSGSGESGDHDVIDLTGADSPREGLFPADAEGQGWDVFPTKKNL